ncbi:MAG: hypothetical protein QXN71_00935 [Candidatus Aenigmatarchaeota archaeon]
MKVIIAIGMVIIFISTFFMLFIFDTVIRRHISCISSIESGDCNLRETGTSLIIGIAFIAMFLIIDSAVLYLIIKTITSSGQSYIAYNI